MNIQNLYKSALVFASAIALVGCLEGESVPKPVAVSTSCTTSDPGDMNVLFSSRCFNIEGQIDTAALTSFDSTAQFSIVQEDNYIKTIRSSNTARDYHLIAYPFFPEKFAENYNEIRIKYKGDDEPTEFKVVFFDTVRGGEERARLVNSEILVNFNTYQNLLNLPDGWLEVSIPFDMFSNPELIANHNGLLFVYVPSQEDDNVFYLTDLALVPYPPFVSSIDNVEHLYSRDSNKDNASFFSSNGNSSLDNFGSGAVFEANHLTDPVFNRAFEVISGEGYGAGVHVGFVASTALGVGFAESFNAIQLKVKNIPTGNLEIKFIGGDNDNRYVVDMDTFAGVVDLGEGWFEVTVPYNLFDRVGAGNALIDSNQNIEINSGLLIGPEGNQGQPFDFYFTDLKLLDINLNN